MNEFYFVIRVFLITLVLVVFLQINMDGETLETKANHIFGSSKTIESIQSSARTLVRTIKDKF